jgi:glyoxylate reductase
MPTILVTRALPDAGLNMLRDAFGPENVKVFPHNRQMTREELLAGVAGADAILCAGDRIDDELLDAAGPQLKIVATYSVGYNHIDVGAATRRGVAITNTPEVLTETTADLAWALLMDVARRISEADRYVRARKWTGWAPDQLLGTDVYGKMLGIFGMGPIGQAVARRAFGFRMPVIYTDPIRLDAAREKELNATAVDKAALLAQSDFLSIHCALTPETRHAFGSEEFKAMKASASLINASRGPVVDEAALASALKTGQIRAAGLDVFENDPEIHPNLFDCENVVLVPHIGSASAETRDKMAELDAVNIIARLAGQRPPNCLNPEVL